MKLNEWFAPFHLYEMERISATSFNSLVKLNVMISQGQESNFKRAEEKEAEIHAMLVVELIQVGTKVFYFRSARLVSLLANM